MSTLPDYKDSTMKLFINVFNFKGNTIDEALAIIAKKKLYSKYFDSQKTDKKTINDAKAGKGSNCVDWGQVYYRIAKSLGYDVQFVHVKCRVSGTGHIRLRLKHKKHTGGNWINRDPAAVADTTSGKGKGATEYWVAVVKPGRVLFEIAGVSEEVAREALRLAMHKLPVKTKFLKREDNQGGDVDED